MNAEKLLKQKGINSNRLVFRIDRREALENLMEAIKEYCPSVKIEKMTAKELVELLDSYGENVLNYHPDNYHQERITLLEASETLKKYGLTDKEETNLDFI